MRTLVFIISILIITQQLYADAVVPNEYFTGNTYNTDLWEIDIHMDPQGTDFYTYTFESEQLKPISPDVGDARYDSLSFIGKFYLFGDFDFQMDAFMHRGGPGQGISFIATDANLNVITYTGDSQFPSFTYESSFSETWFQFRITREGDTVTSYYREIGEELWTLYNTNTYSGDAMRVYFISWDMNNKQEHYDLVDNFILTSGVAYDTPLGLQTDAIPEPATLCLVVSALLGLIKKRFF